MVLVGSVQAYSSGEGREKMKGSIELAFLFLSLGVFEGCLVGEFE